MLDRALRAQGVTRRCCRPAVAETLIGADPHGSAESSDAFDAAIAYTESQIATLALTEDAKEGLASFNERRKPKWTGR